VTKDDYVRVRKPFVPLETKTIFVCESPPISGTYFYDPSNGFHGPLFTAMMRDVLEFEPDSKERGLHEFANRGYLVLDATYQPVNGEGITASERRDIVEGSFEGLVEELHRYGGEDTGIVLVEAR
jgi:hypothetical protein